MSRWGCFYYLCLLFHLFRCYRCHRNSCLRISYPSCLYYPQPPLMYTLHFCSYFLFIPSLLHFIFHSVSLLFFIISCSSLSSYLSFTHHSSLHSTCSPSVYTPHTFSHSDFINRYLIDIPSFLLSSPALLL